MSLELGTYVSCFLVVSILKHNSIESGEGYLPQGGGVVGIQPGGFLRQRQTDGGARGDADHYAMTVALRLFLLLFCAHHADICNKTQNVRCRILVTVCGIQQVLG